MKSILLCSCISLLCQTTAWGLQLPFGRNYYFGSSYPSTPRVVEEPDGLAGSGNFDIFNSSEHLTENGSMQPLAREENLVTMGQNSSESTTGSQPSSNSTTSSSPDVTTGTQTLPAASGKESQSTRNSSQLTSSVAYDGTIKDTNSSETFNITVPSLTNESNETEEEGVARGKPSTTESSTITTPQPQNIYQKAWALVSDTYTLSILVPVAAGVVFATSIILTIACCRCLRRCCVRRRLRKKVLPDSVKNLRPSDRARLLAESSDDEF